MSEKEKFPRICSACNDGDCDDCMIQSPSFFCPCRHPEPLEPFATQAEQQAAEEAMRKAAGIDGERERLREQVKSHLYDQWTADEEADFIVAEVVDPLLAKIRRVEEEIAGEEHYQQEDPAWEITVRVPTAAGDEVAEKLFDVVADAAHEAQPEDRVGWDIFVSSVKGPKSVPVHLLRRALEGGS